MTLSDCSAIISARLRSANNPQSDASATVSSMCRIQYLHLQVGPCIDCTAWSRHTRVPDMERIVDDTVNFGLRRFLRYGEAVPCDTIRSRDTAHAALRCNPKPHPCTMHGCGSPLCRLFCALEDNHTFDMGRLGEAVDTAHRSNTIPTCYDESQISSQCTWMTRHISDFGWFEAVQ